MASTVETRHKYNRLGLLFMVLLNSINLVLYEGYLGIPDKCDMVTSSNTIQIAILTWHGESASPLIKNGNYKEMWRLNFT